MKPEIIQRIIVKYITNSISANELDKLEALLQDPEYDKYFWDFVKVNYYIDYSMKEYNTSESKKLLLNKIRMDKRFAKRNKVNKVLKYAAIAILLLSIGYFIKQGIYVNNERQTLIPKESFITLELDNGNIKVITEDDSSIIKDSKGDAIGTQVGKTLTYVNNSPVEELVFNTLKVPYGKQFKLELSDSTVVYLNSGSSIKFPVKFLKGIDRKIFLTGEAFLAVAEHREWPFIVNSGDMNIRVLGTKFNVSAYPEDKIKEVVLVKGSVELYNEGRKINSTETTILKPGMKGNFDIERKSITTESVITSIYTSWVDGELVFRNMTFNEILKKLERHYDVTIVNKNAELADVEFNASFSNMPVGQIMEYFRSVYGIDFTVDHNKIIIE